MVIELPQGLALMDKIPQYNRVLIKLSGEALRGSNLKFGIDPTIIKQVVNQVKTLVKCKVQIALVIGGGNFFRGKDLANSGIVKRVTADQMGMLATVINGLAFRDAFEQAETEAVLMTAIPMLGLADFYKHHLAIKHLKDNKVVILVAGTGNPLVTTDSAAILRALEIEADLFMKATQVDGIFSADPKTDPAAYCYKKLTYQEILTQELKVMDLTAIMHAREHNLKIIVFNLNKPDSLLNIIYGKTEGTIVDQGN